MPTDASSPKTRDARPLRLAYVPGVTPGKWIGRWNERQGRELTALQSAEDTVLDALRSGQADVVFVRVTAGFDRPADLSVIPLYDELPVVAAAKDHPVAAFEELDFAELADENLLDPAEMGGTDVGMEVVASGAGLLILPMSVAKLYSRRDVVARPLTGIPGTRIAVAWMEGSLDADIEEFVGIVRGRTANSSRQPSAVAEAAALPPKSRRGAAAGKTGQAGQTGKPGKPDSGRGTGKAPGRGGASSAGRSAGKSSGKGPAKGGRKPGKGRGR